jgi:hypothetical protein
MDNRTCVKLRPLELIAVMSHFVLTVQASGTELIQMLNNKKI